MDTTVIYQACCLSAVFILYFLLGHYKANNPRHFAFVLCSCIYLFSRYFFFHGCTSLQSRKHPLIVLLEFIGSDVLFKLTLYYDNQY